MVKVIITGAKGEKSTKDYPLSSTESCWELRKRIADDLKIEMDRVSLSCQGKAVNDRNAVNVYTLKDNLNLEAFIAKEEEEESK